MYLYMLGGGSRAGAIPVMARGGGGDRGLNCKALTENWLKPMY